jgi:hypothetical protein
MCADAGFHADQARRYVGEPRFHLATRPLLPQHDGAARIVAYDVERALADIDADDGDRGIGCLRHGVLLVFGAPCQLRLLAGQEHGRTIPLADIGQVPTCLREKRVTKSADPRLKSAAGTRSNRTGGGLGVAVGLTRCHILDPGMVVSETGALRLSRKAGMILVPHHFVELMRRNAEASAKGAAELLLGKISMVARNGA